jgi:hypothetical protein
VTATTSADSNGTAPPAPPAPPPAPEPGLQIAPELTQEAQPGIVSLHSAREKSPERRIPAFSIDGKVYTILTRPRTNQALRYVNIARKQGSEQAADFMLEVLLGADGYEALLAFEDLTEENLTEVIEACSRIMTGALETPKDRQPNGSRRSAG